MPLVVIAKQHVNWEDDGGDHDPVICEVTEDDLKRLQDLSKLGSIEGEDYEFVRDLQMQNEVHPTMPATFHGVFCFWHGF